MHVDLLPGLENAQLNYIEQHAGRLGLDAERLEGLRVGAAQRSPMADVLDLAARYAFVAAPPPAPPSSAAAAATATSTAPPAAASALPLPGSAESLVPVLTSLVRRGVGLNTKVGTARFIRQLAARLGSDMRPLSGELIKVIL